MANFKPAFDLTKGHEVGWVQNPKDAGAETYNGISRRYHPDCVVWQWIDAAKSKEEFPNNIPHIAMRGVVEEFYKRQFWDKIKGDDIPDQHIAEWLFDIAVNGSPRRAGRFLQRALNLLNRNERDYKDLEIDGSIGLKTISTLKKYLSKREPLSLLFWLGVQMGNHWMNRAELNPDQEEFLNGIGNRWIGNIEHVADQFYLTSEAIS